MRFMMLVIPQDYEKAAADTTPAAKDVEKMMVYNQALQDAGVLVSCEGLHPPSSGARVRLGAGEPTVTDGPFAESRECIGGYWMINVASREEAIAWARKVPAVEPMQIEIRQVQEMDDFPEDVQQAAAGFEQMQTS